MTVLYPDPLSSPAARAVAAAVERAFRGDQGRVVGSLIRSFGDLALAEDSVQEAYVQALRSWGNQVPANPAAWILTTARNRAIDKLRRAGRLESKTAEMAVELDRRQHSTDEFRVPTTIADDRLRLAFLCCHPALQVDAQIALTLRLVAGLTTPQIAGAFMVKPATMAARLTRAKQKVAGADVPFRLPPDHELPERLAAVLHVLYLIFNQGYVAAEGARLDDVDVAREAIRLARLVHALMPDEPEATGLLALMILIHARRDARQMGRRLVLMEQQDRTRWAAAEVDEGCALVERALLRGRPGPYQLQAAIQAVHVEAHALGQTDWAQIVALYGALQAIDSSPVVALNRAVAVSKVDGPRAALELLTAIAEPLNAYHLFHAVQAEFRLQSGDLVAARTSFERALSLTENDVERRHLQDRLRALE